MEFISNETHSAVLFRALRKTSYFLKIGICQRSSLAERLTSDRLKDPVTGTVLGAGAETKDSSSPKEHCRQCRSTSSGCILQQNKQSMRTLVVTTAYLASCNYLCYNMRLLAGR